MSWKPPLTAMCVLGQDVEARKRRAELGTQEIAQLVLDDVAAGQHAQPDARLKPTAATARIPFDVIVH